MQRIVECGKVCSAAHPWCGVDAATAKVFQCVTLDNQRHETTVMVAFEDCSCRDLTPCYLRLCARLMLPRHFRTGCFKTNSVCVWGALNTGSLSVFSIDAGAPITPIYLLTTLCPWQSAVRSGNIILILKFEYLRTILDIKQ